LYDRCSSAPRSRHAYVETGAEGVSDVHAIAVLHGGGLLRERIDAAEQHLSQRPTPVEACRPLRPQYSNTYLCGGIDVCKTTASHDSHHILRTMRSEAGDTSTSQPLLNQADAAIVEDVIGAMPHAETMARNLHVVTAQNSDDDDHSNDEAAMELKNTIL
jgi:hypothetical protein